MKQSLTCFIMLIVLLSFIVGTDLLRRRKKIHTSINQIQHLNKWVQIKNVFTQKCLRAGDLLHQFQCNDMDDLQIWMIQSNPNKAGFYTIKNKRGVYVDLKNGNIKDNNPFWVFKQNWSPNQNFVFEVMAKDKWRIKCEKSNKCLDVLGENKNNIVHIINHPCHKGLKQQWEVIPTQEKNPKQNDIVQVKSKIVQLVNKRNKSETFAKSINPKVNKDKNEKNSNAHNPLKGFFQIRTINSKCIMDKQKDRYAKIKNCNDFYDGFFFRFIEKSEGTYIIKSDIGNALEKNGIRLQSKNENLNDNQKWKLIRREGRKYQIKTIDGKCLCAKHKVRIRKCNDKYDSQIFTLVLYKKIYLKR